MSKKRAKSGAGSAGIQRWEQALLSTSFCEQEKWNASIAFIIGNQLDDYKNLEHLIGVVNSGTRRLFTVVTKDDLYNTVRDLGNPRSKKGKDTPQYYEICEPCKTYLDGNEEIPLPLLAKLVKFKLLDVKQKDLKRRETEKKAASEKEKGGKKGDKGKERSKSPAKGKGGKKTPEPPSAKGETKLKKRGEEDTDSKYIDDEPDDGPHHYVMISGFHQPHLLTYLAEVHVQVDSIVKLSSDDYDHFLPPPPDEDAPPEEKDEKTLIMEEEARVVRERQTEEMRQFWRDILLLMQAAPPGSPLHDVARLEYTVKTAIIPEDLEDNDQKTEFGAAMFEDIACMMYDLLDAKRQWKNYLNNLRLLHVPEYGMPNIQVDAHKEAASQPSMTPAATVAAAKTDTVSQPGDPEGGKCHGDVDMRYYNDLMSSVPQESISVPLVMHCMLEQIVACEEERDPPSETPRPPRSDGLEDSVGQHISNMAFKLALSEDEQLALSNDFDAPKKQEPVAKQPLLISYHDDITRRLNHLKPLDKFDPMAAELDMLGYFPVAQLHEYREPSAKIGKERAARLQELLHFCVTGGLTQAEIEHSLQQFVLECVELSGTSEEDQTVEPREPGPHQQHNIPWDHPYPFFQGMVPAQDEEEAEEEAERRAASQAKGRQSRPRSGVRTSASVSVEPSQAGSPTPRSPGPPGSQEGEGSRPPSAGILKGSRGGSATSRKSHSTHSVRFERDAEGNIVLQPGDELPIEGLESGAEEREASVRPPSESPAPLPEGPTLGEMEALADPMETVNDVQKRNLDQWCFAEHHEPKVLLQVMENALYTHPYVDTYYHKRDNSLLVVLHNPHSPQHLTSQTRWEANLHSNVGFRNYLEHVAESIEEWTRGEEAKHQGTLMAKEVDLIMKEAEDAASRPSSGKGGKKTRDRSKSPKKSPSRGKSPSRSSSSERPPSSNPFVRQGSLKAWKEEQDRVKAEEEEKEKQKQEKRARSAEKKKASKEALDKEKEEKETAKSGKRPNSRQSSKSRLSKDEAALSQDHPAEEGGATIEEPFWPFTGYDVGNNLIHASGQVSTMFPADGGQIKMEKTEFTQGTVFVKTAVVKDGHTFMVHVLDPKVEGQEEEPVKKLPMPEDGMEKADMEKPEKDDDEEEEEEELAGTPIPEPPPKPCVGCFGSFSAQFSDGLSVAVSTYGDSGNPVDGHKYEPAPYIPPPARSPSPTGKEGSPTKGKKGDKNKEKVQTPEPTTQTESEPPKEEELEELVVEEPIPEQPFQQLFLTCPDGLTVTYFLESSIGIAPEAEDERHILVRQAYPFKTRGVQKCEAARKRAMEEVSRVINTDGTIIKTMNDGSVMVMFADGTVSEFCHNSPLLPTSRSASPQRAGSAKSDRETPTKKKSNRKSAGKPKDTVSEAPVEEDPTEKGYWITTLPSGERIATMVANGGKVSAKGSKVCVASDPQSAQTMQTREDHVMTVYMPDGSTVVEHADGTRITTMYHQVEVQVQSTDGENQETGEGVGVEIKHMKLVSVECPGYATVKFDSRAGHCSTELGSGTSVYTSLDGTYDLHHYDGSCLHMEADGTAVYFPCPNNDVDMPNPTQQLQYVMRHFADVVCETVDNMGNVFSVSNTGEASVMTTEGQEEVAQETREGGMHVKEVISYKQHAPRFFILHRDGSGTELLRYQNVANYVAQAEDDPSSAILMDPLPDHPGVIGITVLKPYIQGASERWLKGYELSTIVPPGLTSRDLRTLPPREYKREGPAFGTKVGHGLSVGSNVRAPTTPNILKCPTALELRQILQYKPVAHELREKLGSGLREYAEYVKARLRENEALKVQDPRDEEERQLAADLAVVAAMPEPPSQTPKASSIDGDVKGLYEKVTAPPVPSPPATPQPKRTKADWERDLRELATEQECKRALRDHDVPSYFDSEMGKAFLLSQAPDMEALTKQLSEDPRKDGSRAVRSASATPPDFQTSPDQPQPTDSEVPPSHVVPESIASTITPPDGAPTDNSPSPTRGVTGNTPSSLRPGNPTPAHAQGQGSPAPIRPTNPTPAHASKVVPDRPGAPSPKEASNGDTPSSHAYPSIPEQPQEEAATPDGGGLVPSANSDLVLTRSLAINVLGEPRKDPVHIPAYINTGRPGAILNHRFGEVEDPVRRKTNTLSLTGATYKGKDVINGMRGFEMLPDAVDFGVLREGSTYTFVVHMKNTGVDSCRYKIKQPPPSTGLKVIYKPGSVAAGMKVELVMEIYAIAAGVEGHEGVGTIAHNLEITTETHHIYLPITATVLTAYEYDNRTSDSRCERMTSPGVKLVSSRPPAGQGIIRPRSKELMQSAEMVR